MEGPMKSLSSRKAPKLFHLNFELKKSLCLPRNLPIASGEIAASENPESFIVSPWESEAIWIRYFKNPLKYPEIKTVGKNKGLWFGVFVMVLLNMNNIPGDCGLTARTQPPFCDPASHLETSVHQGEPVRAVPTHPGQAPTCSGCSDPMEVILWGTLPSLNSMRCPYA